MSIRLNLRASMASLTMTLLAVGCALTLTGGVDAQTASINKIHPNPPQHQSQPPLRNEESGSNVGAPEVPLLMQGKPINVSHTVIAMVVDRSGSMVSMGPEVAGGCNAYLDAQRAADLENNRTTTVLLTTFDTVLERVVDGVPLPSVDPVTQEQVAPRGGTALHDAIGDTIVRTIHHLNTLPAQPDVVVFILTDGEENSSQTWKAAAISDQIKRLEKKPHGWTFYFAAANQDAVTAGARLGVGASNCLGYGTSGDKLKSAFKSAHSAYQRKVQGDSDGSFSDAERVHAE